jgi:hypothetical protein
VRYKEVTTSTFNPLNVFFSQNNQALEESKLSCALILVGDNYNVSVFLDAPEEI